MPEYQSFIGIDQWTVLFTLVNMIITFLVLKKFLFKPVMKMIDDRQQEIDTMYQDAGAAKQSAEAMEIEYKAKLAAAQKTGDQIVKDAVARGQTREDEIIRLANQEAAALRAKAAADIAREKKKAINDAKNEISGMAMAIAEKVVERQLNAADQDRMISSFIDGLGDKA